MTLAEYLAEVRKMFELCRATFGFIPPDPRLRLQFGVSEIEASRVMNEAVKHVLLREPLLADALEEAMRVVAYYANPAGGLKNGEAASDAQARIAALIAKGEK